ncbi:MAG: hypothetical protein ACI9UO_002546 [Nitrospinales bacterium]|jgi:hypothetical protein
MRLSSLPAPSSTIEQPKMRIWPGFKLKSLWLGYQLLGSGDISVSIVATTFLESCEFLIILLSPFPFPQEPFFIKGFTYDKASLVELVSTAAQEDNAATK